MSFILDLMLMFCDMCKNETNITVKTEISV